MASPSSSEQRDGQQRPGKLARQNSSFYGAIKNIVKAPLTWFANQDDADSSTPGKRRRQLDQETANDVMDEQQDSSMQRSLSGHDDEQLSHRSKRMRLHSPPRQASQPYLDPPTAFLRHPDPARTSSVIPRASSAVLPSSRATLSPRRHLPVTRTMSIDPPKRTLALKEGAAFNFGPMPSSEETPDYEMAIDSYGNMTTPPSPRRSPRPSFRLRSSVTPQPQHQLPTRYISEPPALKTLVSRPVFLHPPTEAAQPTLPPTLGALVETVKATNAPARQHSSLVLNPVPIPENLDENEDAPAEKALHQLDVYKTPLLPTRMRSSHLPASITAATTPDLFKSRRKSHLVLMQDERDRTGRRGKGPTRTVNETKPYAGEGGMKKLLARRKQEVEEENGKQKEQQDMDTSAEANPDRQGSSVTPDIHATSEQKEHTLGESWFSTAVSTSSSGSSLRVGRTITRNHIARPGRARFSAKYDDDADVDEAERREEKRADMAEDAKKMVSLFPEPAGFTFSLEAPPMVASKSDDPNMFPITSLPFSLSKSMTSTPKDSVSPPSNPPIEKEDKVSSAVMSTPDTTTERVLASEQKISETFNQSTSLIQPSQASSSGGPPNFFANSKLVTEVKMPSPPPVMNFGKPMPPSVNLESGVGPFSFSAPPSHVQDATKPVNQPGHPFWDSGKEKEPQPHSFFSLDKKEGNTPKDGSSLPPSTLFDVPASASTTKTSIDSTPSAAPTGGSIFSLNAAPATSSLFGTSSGTSTSAQSPIATTADSKIETAAHKPTFGSSSGATSVFGDATKVTASSSVFAPQSTTPSLSFGFDASTGKPAAADVSSVSSSQPSFGTFPTSGTPAAGSSKSLFSVPSNKAVSFEQPSTENEEPKGSFSFGKPNTDKEEPKAPFFFGQSSTEKKEDKASFSFGSSNTVKEEVKAPFSFGTAPSTPSTSIAAPAAIPFSFGQTSTTPAATPPISFSFSGGGSAATDVSNKPVFSFGQPSIAAQADRPVTPPKNENEFRMEESPTRELQQASVKPPELRPTIGGGSFAFGSSSSTAGNSTFFGTQPQAAPTAASTPFSFGNPTSNPFATKEAEEPKSFSSFGQATPPVAPPLTTSFSFGQTKPSEDTQRPLSGGGFTFGATPTSTTAPSNPFSFGAGSGSNPFGQPASGSAPSSPSTFNQPSPFAFGAPPPAPFAFGSQPNSPASGGNLSLPASGFGSSTGFGQSQQPSSPFSGPIALAPSTSGGGGGSLFTIGSAPAPAPPGARTIKKLPNRRPGAKR